MKYGCEIDSHSSSTLDPFPGLHLSYYSYLSLPGEGTLLKEEWLERVLFGYRVAREVTVEYRYDEKRRAESATASGPLPYSDQWRGLSLNPPVQQQMTTAFWL